MGRPANKDSLHKKNIFYSMRTELRYMHFPDRKKLFRTSGAVITASLVGGALFSAYNGMVSYIVSLFL